MRDRISEHLQFLQNKKHILLVKQNELATVRPQTAGVTAGPVGRGPGDLSDSGTEALPFKTDSTCWRSLTCLTCRLLPRQVTT